MYREIWISPTQQRASNTEYWKAPRLRCEGGVTIERACVPRIFMAKLRMQQLVAGPVEKRTRRILSRIRLPFKTDLSYVPREAKYLENMAPSGLGMFVRPYRQQLR